MENDIDLDLIATRIDNIEEVFTRPPREKYSIIMTPEFREGVPEVIKIHTLYQTFMNIAFKGIKILFSSGNCHEVYREKERYLSVLNTYLEMFGFKMSVEKKIGDHYCYFAKFINCIAKYDLPQEDILPDDAKTINDCAFMVYLCSNENGEMTFNEALEYRLTL